MLKNQMKRFSAKLILNLLSALVVIGVLAGLIFLLYWMRDKIVTQLGVRLLATIGIYVGKFLFGLLLVSVVIGIIGSLVNYLWEPEKKQG